MARSISSTGISSTGLASIGREAGGSPAFIAEQTAGSVLRNALALYRSNFRPLFLTYALPIFPLLVAQYEAQTSGNQPLFFVIVFVVIVGSFFATGAITVTISDICLGNRPTVHRSYAKLLEGRLWLSLLMTNLLQGLIVGVGLVLFLVPGLVLVVRLITTSTVVVLERRAGVVALKRSWFLSKGHFWRLLGLYIAIVCVVMAMMVPMIIVLGVGGALLHGVLGGYERHVISTLLGALLGVVLYPPIFIAFVLMYYDLRVRKEAYDLAALSEDMMW